MCVNFHSSDHEFADLCEIYTLLTTNLLMFVNVHSADTEFAEVCENALF